ncbi:zinc metalloproteinase nas-15-like isoform X2 [Mercenaria mercenaria]|uniref:zinc metalloproteinase nas-15-like isoform X2 n=1 Tax=Mercenaria mercenaria TaxID=6596 RepID=UPI00234F143B|nr:zinc metalloproteinase nas-15-like isoform X2 [Mercenaria mercenaria]
MDIWKLLVICILKIIVSLRLSAAQVLMEELKAYKIDALTLNGTEPYTELTIDQIIMRASGGEGMAQNLMLGDDGTVLAELDMRLTQNQFFTLYEQPSNLAQAQAPPRGKRRAFRKLVKEARKKSKRTKRKAIRDTVLRWTDGVIPYRFVSGHFQDKERYMIRSAMTEWEKYTCLKFRESRSSDRNVVRFQNGLGCNSQLGMVGGEQPLNLDRNGCRFKGLYLHEIGHAIGLVHEHQLPDRDNYIEILDYNVQPNMRIWFNKYSSQEVNQMQVPYEYSSVMHYGITAFSHDGKAQTIRAKQTDKEKTIGRVYKKELSFTDVKIVNLMYKCSAHCDKSIICNGGGYVDQNCKCICPDGSDSCTKDKTPDDPTCFNAHENWQCNVWANQGECDRNPRFMLDGCKKACHLCGNDDAGDDTCKDQYEQSKCQTWKFNGECIVNKKWMQKYCKATCKACKESGPDPDVDCSNAHTDDSECDKWATEGECQINPIWMPENCRKSCHMCGDAGKRTTTTPEPTPEPGKCEDIHNSVECKGWADTGECDLNPDWMIPNCRRSCKKCGDGGQVECKNTWNDRQCEGWARDAECMKNSNWMHKNCYKSCSKCSPDDSSTKGKTEMTTRATTARKDSGSCTNNHRSDKECETWAKYGHCKINQWMTIHCAKSCGECTAEEATTSPPDTKDKKEPTVCKDDKLHCPAWAQNGFCEDNPATALRICKKSCNSCNSSSNECFDKHQLCPVWARGNQCQRNGGYMLRNCRRSCEVC